jgi:hypothetical protein
MTYLTLFFRLFLAFCILSCGVSSAENLPIPVDRLASILNYPVEDISVEDITESRNRIALRKKRNVVLSSHIYSGPYETFARLTITTGKKGTLLTKEMIDYAEKGVALKGTGISEVTLPELGKGYFGLGILGPGGSDERVILTLPGLDRDLQITITIPGETRLEPVEGHESYLDFINDNAKVKEMIVKCAEIVATKMTQTQSPAIIQNPKIDQNAPNTKLDEDREVLDSDIREIPKPVSKGDTVHPVKDESSRIPWIIAGVLLLSILGLLFRKYMRPSNLES